MVHLQRIHTQLFKELHEWAGQFRLVDMAKGKTLFCRVAFLDSEATRIFRWLAPYIRRPIPDVVPLAQVVGELMTHLNMLHPFREGNGRTQREFVRQFARFHGFDPDYERMDGERYVAASVADDPRAMTAALQAAIVNPSPDRSLRAQYRNDAEPDWER